MDLGLPLQGGFLQRVPPNATKEQQAVILNDVIDKLNSLLKTQVFSDGITKRFLIGYQKDGWGTGQDFGMKMSQVGIDVTTATASQLLFSMSMESWTWRNNSGDIVKQFANETGTDSYYDPTGRNYVNIGLRLDPATYGFEMAKPTQDFGNGPI